VKLAQIAVLTGIFAIVALTVVPADERVVTGLEQNT
jgi:VanZ family protein